MALTLKAVLVCDDVRFETGHKISAMGILNEQIVLHGAQGATLPVALPRLATVFMIAGLLGKSVVSVRHRFKYPGWPAVATDALQEQRHDPSADLHNFVNILSPAVFPSPGLLQIALELVVDDQTTVFEHSVRVTFGPPQGPAPTGAGRSN